MNVSPTLIGTNGPVALAEKGFSLVEMMIAMVAGLLLAAGIGQVFLSTKQAYRTQDQLSRLQENGRYAIEMLTHDLRMAGSLGCQSRAGSIQNVLKDTTSLYFNFLRPVEGFEANNTGPGQTYSIPTDSSPAQSVETEWTLTLPDVSPKIRNTVERGTDVLILRGRVGPGTPLQTATPALLITPNTVVAKGDLTMVADCTVTRIFQVSSVKNGQELGHAAATSGQPGNACDDWDAAPCPTHSFPTLAAPVAAPADGAPAEVAKVATTVYFIGRRADDTGAGPVLYRRIVDEDTSSPSLNLAQELVEGVESMQVLYGVTADGINIQFVTAANVLDWATVTSIRVGLLMRTPDEVNPAKDTATYQVNGSVIDPLDDRRIRRVITSTISLRNLSP